MAAAITSIKGEAMISPIRDIIMSLSLFTAACSGVMPLLRFKNIGLSKASRVSLLLSITSVIFGMV